MTNKSVLKASAFVFLGAFLISAPQSFAKSFKGQHFESSKDVGQLPQNNQNSQNSYGGHGAKFKDFSPPPSNNSQPPPEQKKFFNAPPADNGNNVWQKPPQSAPNPPSFKFGGENDHGNKGGDNGWQKPPQSPPNPPSFKFGGNKDYGHDDGNKNWQDKDKNWDNHQSNPPNSYNGNNSGFKFKDNNWNNNQNQWGQKHFDKPQQSQKFTNFHFKKDRGYDYWGPYGNWNSWNNSWGDPYYYARRWGFDEYHPSKGWRRGKYWYSNPSQWSDWGGWFSFFLSSGIWGFSYDSGYDPYYSNYGNECLRLFDEDWYYGRRAVFSFIGCRDYWGRFIEVRGTRRFENYSY